MGLNITVTKRGPGAAQIQKRLADIVNSDVLVGIPQVRANRSGEAINNASLMYIHTHGSPVNNIPPRPVIEPAIAASGNREAIAKELAGASKAFLEENPTLAKRQLERAGIAGANASKAWFTDPRNHWPPNAPSTIKRKGSDRPLIDTGALRQSITYVVRASATTESAVSGFKTVASEAPEV